MNGGLYVILTGIVIFLYVADIALLGRAVLSWFPEGGQSRIGALLYVITEPFIMPVRWLCSRLGWFQGMPLDMPFLITSLLLLMISSGLRSILWG